MSDRKPGRPTLLTEKVLEQIAAGTRAGMKPHQVAMQLGIARATFSHWMTGTRQREYKLQEAVAEASAYHQNHLVKLIQDQVVAQVADKPEFALRWLQSCHRDDWGDTQKIEVQLKREVDSTMSELLARAQAAMTPEAYEQLLGVVLASAPGLPAADVDPGDEEG